jgi:hypothetical protein
MTMGIPVDQMPLEIDLGELQTRYVEMGEMAIRHARIPAMTDMGPVLAGLPRDRCPSPHWGIVLAGSLTLVHCDGSEETVHAGEVSHWPAGHTATSDYGATFLEVGPVGPMRQFGEHARRRLMPAPAG